VLLFFVMTESGRTDWKSSFIGVAIGAGTGTVIGLLGFFVSSQSHPAMGLVLFALVPFGAGFSITLVTRSFNSAVAAAMLAVLASLVLLIAMRTEGLLCAILAFPIILVSLLIGVGIGILVRKFFPTGSNNHTTMTGMLLVFTPALFFAGEKIETPTMAVPRTEVIENAIEVHATPEQTWNHILTIDDVQASKPFLMHIGLPIPQKCTLQGQGVGAKRTCYFDAGYIQETVTAWNPPYEMKLTIDRTQMPGRHWLGFENAEYQLEAVGAVTKLTRRTTIVSYLHPAWYWRRFERWGVESEHEYILRDVAARAH
jgi:hypothetical protein